MRIWRLCVVLGLLAGAAGARADWPPEPPPVPPDTEDAQRQRPEPAASSGKRDAQTPPARSEPAAHSSGDTTQQRHRQEALREFPPAPPPVVPGAAPEKPNAALTSFAPAPAPGPEGGSTREASPTAMSGGAAPAAESGAQPAAADSSLGAQVEASRDAAAESGEVERAKEVWSAAALFGIGATFDKTIAGVNPMGFGFGVRADYRILPDWAIGARMLYFVGGSVELPSDDVAMQSWLVAAEAAYALEFDPVSIEPGLALGLFVRETNYRGYPSFSAEPTFSVPDSTRLFFYLAPGVNVSVPLSVATPALAPLSVGADVRLDLAFGKRVTSNIQLLLQVGLRF